MRAVTGSSKVWLVVGGFVLVIILAVGALVYKLASPSPTPVPTTYARYTAPDNSFVCDAPAGWASSGTAAQAVASSAKFSAGSAVITISSDTTGSIMADIGRATGNAMGGSPVPQVEKRHQAHSEALQAKFQNYNEKPASSFTSGLGDSRVSEFTADGGFMGGKIHGYHVTMLTSDRDLSLVCQCREEDWQAISPVFVRVFNSLAAGK
jgi:hypothetical protein